MSINLKELSELLAAIAANNITELTLKNADFELTVSQGQPTIVKEVIATTVSDTSLQTVAIPVPEAQAGIPPAAPTIDKKWVEIKSPMVGTFYRSPSPDEPPFTAIGDKLRVGQTVCIIEAMKLMNEIESETTGQVMEILVENGQPVEFGQTLMYVNPA